MSDFIFGPPSGLRAAQDAVAYRSTSLTMQQSIGHHAVIKVVIQVRSSFFGIAKVDASFIRGFERSISGAG